MIKFAYVVLEDVTKYIEVTLDSYRSEVIQDGLIKICPEAFKDNLNRCY